MKQSLALDILKTGKNVFLTGSAGSGKTYTLNQYIHYLRARKVPVAVTASTGIAATHMSGTTIHSWAGIGIKDDLEDRDLANLSRKKMLRERVRETSVLIIDEISMLHAKQFNLVNKVLQHLRRNNKPFGDIQVIVAGDFFQLPPIGSRGESNRDKFAFMSESWLDADFKICYLTEQHRQDAQDTTQQDTLNLDAILNQIREQNVTQAALDTLEQTFYQDVDINRTRLYTHNLNVNSINNKELEKLDTKAVNYKAIAHGEGKLVDTLKKSVRTSDDLTLKVGAKVMFIKNNSEMGVSNGTMGEVTGFLTPKVDKNNNLKIATHDAKKGRAIDGDDTSSNDIIDDDATINDATINDATLNDATLNNDNETKQTGQDGNEIEDNENKTAFKPVQYPMVKLNSGRSLLVAPDEWSIEDETGEVLASYEQVPLTLAWAITIHKSQGMTLDAAEIDLSKTFELGQGYVALSRLKSLDGLKLLGMNDMSLRLDPLARGADRRFRELSDEASTFFKARKRTELQQTQDAFILMSGGTLSDKEIKAYESLLQRRKERKKQLQDKKDKLGNQVSDESGGTLISTKLLLQESFSIAEIAETRGLAQSTIVNHIARLKRQEPDLNLDVIRPEDDIIDQVAHAVKTIKDNDNPDDLKDDGTLKIRPVYEALREQVDYNTIRLAMIFITK